MRLSLSLLSLWILLAATPARASQFLYTYTGNTYGSMLPANPAFPPTVGGAYTLEDFVSGYLLFDEALILPDSRTFLAKATPLAYSFSDGVQTLTQDNSTILFSFGGPTLFARDAAWIVSITGVTGEIHSYVDLFADSGDSGSSADGFGHVRVNPNPSPGNPGVWRIEQTPEPSTLLLIAAGIGSARWHRRRARR